MKKRGKRYSQEQILAVLKEAEGGMTVAELCRRHGVSEATLYNWRRRYGGMDRAELARLRELEAENTRLKRIVAKQALENDVLREVNSKKW
jgi:putative transposase